MIDYGPYAQYGLPYGVKEYAADGVTEIRQTFTDYNLSQAYLDRRIIGLISEVHLTDVSSWQGKITYGYDDPARLQNVPSAATQHDTGYNSSFTARGNVTSISQWDFTDIVNPAKRLTTYTNYYTTGSPASTTDPAGHTNSIAYTDSFSDSINRNTFAYPTTLTDADGFSSYVQYNYDLGATTRTQSPAPAGQSQGAIQTMDYNSLGQLQRITTANNGAYKYFWYGADYAASYSTVNNVTNEAFSVDATDGLGRIVLASGDLPASVGGYHTVHTIYDQMGRAAKQSNPTEINGTSVPSGDDAAGFYYTQQTYDWNGRRLVTTNPDGTTKEASYAGCGCAGGEVVTLTDEGTIDGGVAKRRQQRIYSDVLGRTVKTELLNWQGGSVYSTTVNTYNARNQVTQVRDYAGTDSSGTYQTTTVTYDGYGRLKTKHEPEQDAGANTTWDYNTEGALQKITDGRGAATNYSYNNRHLLTGVTYSVPSGSQIPVPAAVTYGYDAASNRTSMTDGTGAVNYSYDSLSRMTSESRTFTGLTGTYALNYSYNLANSLTSLAIPFRSQQIGYTYDTTNRLSGVTASGFTAYYYPYSQNISSFASNFTYRAWGGRKGMTYGNTTSEQVTYDSRLRPATYTLNNMNYQNTNVCCSYPTYSTMTWSYGYYADGRVEHAWDSTNDWFDRAYKYDHAGRVKEASTYRRARGLSPFPTVPNRDPYYQSITYDVWNHSSRTGLFYTAEPSDVATYTNNRRSGWQYDADGNTTWDASYRHTLDAAGADTQSVSHATISYGFPYPLPQVDITQTYDGLGQPGKRVQISRQAAEMDEWGNEWPAVEDTQTTYYVRSSVLAGAAVVELNPGLSDTVNIYAGGQRIARQIWDSVIFEHHNPVTGSWVTSLGHSSYRTTNREERDIRGGEVPTSNPYAWAEGYSDWKFGSPIYIDGGDPFDYSSGRSIDGLPVSEAEFQRRLGKDVGIGTFVNGKSAGFVNLTGRTFLNRVTFDVFRPPNELADHPELWGDYYDHSFEEGIDMVGSQTTKRQTTKPQNVGFNMAEITKRINQTLSNPDCLSFYQRILSSASPKNPPLDNGNMVDIFRRFLAQSKGGLTRKRPKDNAGFGGAFGRLTDGDAKIFSPDFGPEFREFLDAQATLAELMHHAGSKEWYTDYELAVAAHNIPEYAKQFDLSASSNVFDPSYLQMKNGKVVGKGPPTDKDDGGYSSYIHNIERRICPVRKK